MDRDLAQISPCLISGVVQEIDSTRIEEIDLLFVIDSSGSMEAEQQKLRDQIPELVRALTTGVRRDGSTFPKASNINLGVISTDMGLPDIGGAPWGCSAFGDDGLLRTEPGAEMPVPDTCRNPLPKFVNYKEIEGTEGATRAIHDVSCLAQVGAAGCGFEMQLEAALKALTPSTDLNRTFLGDGSGITTVGHADGFNAGFLRNDTSAGQSLIAVILVTDEDDCSSMNTDHLHPVDPSNARPDYDWAPPNLRCTYFKQNLWSVQRYVDGLKALRPGREELVIFGAITGVPQSLVSQERLDQVDLKNDQARNAFYDDILAHPDMQERELMKDGIGQGVLADACTPFDEQLGAKPARRIIDVVRGFGKNGVLQSICHDNYEGAIDRIIAVISDILTDVCLPRPLVRNAEGRVDCKVIWELPAAQNAATEVATRCDDPKYVGLLTTPEDPDKQFKHGRARCIVNQLATDGIQAPDGNGWFYDDFTQKVDACKYTTHQRVAFNVAPPNGVTVKLECLNETQSIPDNRVGLDHLFYQQSNLTPPHIGTDCSGEAAACHVRFAAGQLDSSTLFCHQSLNVCAQACTSDTHCPGGWQCDSRQSTIARAGQPICVNPVCGADSGG